MTKQHILLMAGCTAIGLFAAPAPRWNIERNGEAIVWHVKDDARLPHADSYETSGRRVSLILGYGVDANRALSFSRTLVWPAIRIQPNNTHGSLKHAFKPDEIPALTVDGAPCAETADAIEHDGILTARSTGPKGLSLVRRIFPSTTRPATFETLEVKNGGARPVTLAPTKALTESFVLGCSARYAIRARMTPATPVTLQPGQTAVWSLRLSATRVDEREPDTFDAAAECAARRARVRELTDAVVLETGDPVLDTAFRFAKIRAGESIFETAGGLMHGPGGGSYYAATWCNDQVEYAGPWFAYTGDATALEASFNAYRHYMPFMAPDYQPIPSSVIAEGRDYWNGAGDRGDAAMWACGATRFVLASGRRDWAKALEPGLRWTLEFCRRKLNAAGVVASDKDELEGRLPAGDANLCTSALCYDALRHAAILFRELGDADFAAACARRAEALAQAMDRHFGCEMHGFRTYRYYEGCPVLRSWIGIPLCMGLYDRADGTADALFSPFLWTGDGMLCAEGDKARVTWDRSVLYAFRGVLAAHRAEKVMSYLRDYSTARLLGEHVPYPVEAWPEGGRRHLSAESALYCRVFTEGLFGIDPTGFGTFAYSAALPKGISRMSLRNVRAFGRTFDIDVTPCGSHVSDEK